MRTFTEKLTDLFHYVCSNFISTNSPPGSKSRWGGGGGGFNSRPLTREPSATTTEVLLLVASFASVFTREKSLNENCVLENVAEQILVNEFTIHRKKKELAWYSKFCAICLILTVKVLFIFSFN